MKKLPGEALRRFRINKLISDAVAAGTATAFPIPVPLGRQMLVVYAGTEVPELPVLVPDKLEGYGARKIIKSRWSFAAHGQFRSYGW